MTVWVAEDRSIAVSRDQIVQTAWIDINLCMLGSRVQMSPEAVEKAFRRLLCLGDQRAPWPPIVGRWEGARFVVCDGRHELIAALTLGRDRVFVAWVQAAA
jgi:hypothetical protein